MNRFATILAFIALSVEPMLAQKSVQNGMVREQNSKRKPLSGVQITCDDAVPTSSDAGGYLRLVFDGKKPGDLIFFREITKSGYELVNNKELEILKISRNDTLGRDIILAKAGTVDAAKKEYYGVSDKALFVAFEKEKRSLREELAASKLNEQQFIEQLELLQQSYDNQRRELDVLSEKFARINFDDVDSVYRKALEHFKAGKIDEAIVILERANTVQRTEQIIREEKSIAEDEKQLVLRKVALAKAKTEQIAAISLLADMYTLKFDPVRAESQYDQLLQLDSTDLEILQNAADFYRENDRYQKGIRLYRLIIDHIDAEEWQVAEAQGFLGDLYLLTGNLTAAFGLYSSYFGTLEKILPNNLSFYFFNPIIYNRAIAYSNVSLAHIYEPMTYFEKYSQRGKNGLDAYPIDTSSKKGAAIYYYQLGIQHRAQNIGIALTYFEKFFKLMDDLYTSYPQNVDFKNGLAIAYEELGSVHVEIGHLDSALMLFERRCQLGEQLYAAYPQNVDFKNELAIFYGRFGALYQDLGHLDSSLILYEKSRGLQEEICTANPQNIYYRNNLASTYKLLGRFSLDKLHDREKAKKNLQQAKVLYNELLRDAPGIRQFVMGKFFVEKELSGLDK